MQPSGGAFHEVLTGLNHHDAQHTESATSQRVHQRVGRFHDWTPRHGPAPQLSRSGQPDNSSQVAPWGDFSAARLRHDLSANGRSFAIRQNFGEREIAVRHTIHDVDR